MTKQQKWYLNAAISLCLMIFVRFIPAPELITPLGMAVVGIFAGCIYGWCTTNLIWPSLIGLVLFGFTGYTTPSAAWGTLISGGVVALAFWLMIAVGLLNNTGLTQYLANWSISRKFTKGKPWTLIIVIYICTIACGSIINAIGTILVFWPLTQAIMLEVGYEKGDKAPAWTTFSIVLLTTTASFIMPFQMAVVSNFGFLAAGSGGAYDGSFNYGAYLIFTLILQVVFLIGWMLLSKYVLRINLDKLKNYVPDTTKVIKMRKDQKIGLYLFILLFVLLMAPSFLPKSSALFAMANTLGSVGACILVVGIACLLHVDGKPFLDFGELVSKNMLWTVILMFGTAFTLAGCINSPDSGVIAFVKSLLSPIFEGLSPYLFVIVFMAIAMILTNFINNVVISAIMVPVSWTFSTAFGLNPIAVVACFILFVDFAIMLPSASPNGAMMHSSGGWIPKNIVYKYGFIALAMLFLVSIIIGWPLANVLF